MMLGLKINFLKSCLVGIMYKGSSWTWRVTF